MWYRLRVSSPAPLPYAHSAVIPAAKLRDYVLNPAHPQGAKARVFAAALGLTQPDWRELRQQLLAALPTTPATHRGSTPWGELYDVTITIHGQHGRTAPVRTGWIYHPGDTRPYLTTAYVDRA